MFSKQRMKNKINKNRNRFNHKPLRNSIIWVIINSLLFINLSILNTENLQSERRNEAVVSANTLSNLEQNLSERNSRSKILEKYNLSEITASLESQNLLTPDEAEFINLTQASLSVYSSTQNNHSLRSPPFAS